MTEMARTRRVMTGREGWLFLLCHDSKLTRHDEPLGRRHDASKMTARSVRSARIWATFSPTRRGTLTGVLPLEPALAVTTSTIW